MPRDRVIEQVIEVPAEDAPNYERNGWVRIGVRRDMREGKETVVKLKRSN
jgi:hypothetical protein